MVTATKQSAVFLTLVGCIAVLLTSGCSALQGPSSAMLEQQVSEPEPGDDEPTVVVELRTGDEDREFLRAPLKGSMLVQDALKGSGATSRFRRMDVVLVRDVPGPDKLRLPIHYDPSQRRVADANNYAMHSGDWLVVTEDTSTAFDRMIESALEPLQPVLRSYRD